jgi:uncharacterized protein DUF4129
MGGRALVRRFWPVALVLVLLAAAWLVAAGPGVRLRQLPAGKTTCLLFCQQRGNNPSMPPAGSAPPPAHVGTGSGVNIAGVVFVALAVLVVVAVLVAITLYLMLTAREAIPFLRRRKELDIPLPGFQPPTADQVREAVEVGLSDLSDQSDPRRAVIACWLRLEALAERAGAARQPSDTPSDLVARLLAEHLLDTGGARRAIDELAEVYRLARYAPHPVGEDARQTARGALERLRAELAAGPVGEAR